MTDCVFCKIVNKTLKSNVYFEDDDFLVFKPIEPVAKGHLLVIPKTHYENIFDIEEATLGKLIVLAKEIGTNIVKSNHATGINILHASGKDAQQSVMHFHIHLVPRYPNDGLDLWIKNNL